MNEAAERKAFCINYGIAPESPTLPLMETALQIWMRRAQIADFQIQRKDAVVQALQGEVAGLKQSVEEMTEQVKGLREQLEEQRDYAREVNEYADRDVP